ncbi:glycosyltransferase family 2 protein [Arcticibacter sp.]|uniref:glycosyltransferase family 2 protein n=1 Tax=Arcticibacter sp. TaxID=1872630 RepID=UPI0038906D30
MRKGITIIICTYNGAERLSETIAHIARQSVPETIAWEVILADNGSSDNSIALAGAEWNKYKRVDVPFEVIEESKPGKLHALQHAIEKADFEYLIVCDDDNWLASDYLKTAYSLLDSRPEIAAAGGRGTAVTAGMLLPDWFKDYHSAYAVGPQAQKTGFLKPRDVLWGAGLCTRKSVYQKMYRMYPSFLTEHQDKNILSAEDTEYCMRLLLKGYKLYYDASLQYKHFIPDHKLSLEFRDQKLLKGFMDANEILRKYYSAMRATIKTRNRPDVWFALLLITPINYVFSFSKRRAEKAKNTLFFLLPFGIQGDPISEKIRMFMKGKPA